MNMSYKKVTILLVVIIALAAFSIYIPTLKSGFLWDDVQLITHPLKTSNNPYGFFFGSGLYYRPILHLFMALDYSFWHLKPPGYHITNILLHILNSLLIFAVGIYLLKNKKMGSGGIPSFPFLAAMIFALHPIHTESVAWISGRTDVLATLFFLLAFLSYLIYEKEEKTVGLFLSGFFFLCSLFSKENALSFIFVALAYGIVSKMPARKVLLSLLIFSLIIVTYFFLRRGGMLNALMAPPGSKSAFFSLQISFKNFFPILSGGVGYYIEKLILPFNLNLMPQIPERPVYLLISLLPFVFGVILYFSERRLEVFLLTWIIVTMLPSLPILFSQVSNPIGERYLYLPSAGFAILLAALVMNTEKKKTALVSILAILIAYTISTHERLDAWKDEVTLWEDTVRKSPDSANALTNYGAALLAINKVDKAREELLIALKQRKISAAHASAVLYLLGTVELKQNNYKKAEEYLINSLKTNPQNDLAYNNLGVVYMNTSRPTDTDARKKDDLGKAIKYLEQALRVSPGFLQPKYNLALCYLKMGDFKRAKDYFNAVIESDPLSDLSAGSVQHLLLMEFSKRYALKAI